VVDYYNRTFGFDEHTTAIGGEVKSELDAIESAFTAVNNDIISYQISASASAAAASASAVSAASSESTASAAASSATYSASSASISEANAASSFASFDDRYLGAKGSNPTVDNDGNALLTGALHWNTPSNVMRVFDGLVWTDVVQTTAGTLQAANNLSDVSDKALGRSNLGVAIGTNVQAYDALLQAISALNTSADNFPYFTGLNTVSQTALTSFMRTLLDDTDAATARTTLGVASASDVSSHAADATKHITTAQNTLLDGLEANGTTATELNKIHGISATTSTPTGVFVEIGGDGLIKMQSIANFFNKVGQALHLNANRGRMVNTYAYTNGTVLIPGYMYMFCRYWPPNSWALPTVANTTSGDTITLVSMKYQGMDDGWSATYQLTITCSANVYIHLGASGESLVLDDSKVGVVSLICSYCDGVCANWSIGY
jgi:hypothetical protein